MYRKNSFFDFDFEYYIEKIVYMILRYINNKNVFKGDLLCEFFKRLEYFL